MPKFEFSFSMLKSALILLASSCLLIGNAFGGGSVGVAGFILPDGTVMQAQEIDTYDFIYAISNINNGYSYEIDQNEQQLILDSLTFKHGIPLIEGLNENNEKVSMIESSIIKNNFELDNSGSQKLFVSKPDSSFIFNNNVWQNQLEVREDVFLEFLQIHVKNIKNDLLHQSVDELFINHDCYSPTSPSNKLNVNSINESRTLIYSSTNQDLLAILETNILKDNTRNLDSSKLHYFREMENSQYINEPSQRSLISFCE